MTDNCIHQRDAIGELSNQTALVNQGKRLLRPGVPGLSKAALRRNAIALHGMITMYERVFGYGHSEIKPAMEACHSVLGTWGMTHD